MTKPTTLRVLGMDVPVEYKDVSEDTCLDDKYGYWDGPRERIILDKDRTLPKQKETLLHELLHCLEDVTMTEIGEAAVFRLSRALFAVGRDNPGLIEWVMSREAK